MNMSGHEEQIDKTRKKHLMERMIRTKYSQTKTGRKIYNWYEKKKLKFMIVTKLTLQSATE